MCQAQHMGQRIMFLLVGRVGAVTIADQRAGESLEESLDVVVGP